jgi:hypothetical protein
VTNGVFWDVNAVCRVRRLIVTSNVVPSSTILVTLMMEAISSSETSVLTRIIRRNIPEDNILNNLTRLSNKPQRYAELMKRLGSHIF